jgi:non-canonical (house-cleaning) NTP pyrophosphatase
MLKTKIVRVVVTSSNKVKITATHKGFATIFCNHNIIVDHLSTDFSFLKIPSRDITAIELCRKRMEYVQNIKTYDFIVSLEGIISKRSYGCFVYGWACIKSCRNNRESIGCSVKVQIPKKIAKCISYNLKPSSVFSGFTKYYCNDNINNIDTMGINGIITNGVFTRVSEFEGAICSALGYLTNNSNYQI